MTLFVRTILYYLLGFAAICQLLNKWIWWWQYS